MSEHGWIGVDLDGTLAQYSEWKGSDHIGAPVRLMLLRVLDWCNAGKDVRIVTARAGDPFQIPIIEAWCLEHLGRILPVTNRKDYQMIELWDDRAVSVERNTGVCMDKRIVS